MSVQTRKMFNNYKVIKFLVLQNKDNKNMLYSLHIAVTNDMFYSNWLLCDSNHMFIADWLLLKFNVFRGNWFQIPETRVWIRPTMAGISPAYEFYVFRFIWVNRQIESCQMFQPITGHILSIILPHQHSIIQKHYSHYQSRYLIL